MEAFNEYNILVHSAWCERTVADLYSLLELVHLWDKGPQFPLLSRLCLCSRKNEVLCLFSRIKQTKVKQDAAWERCHSRDIVVIASCVITSFSRGVTECQIWSQQGESPLCSAGTALKQPRKPFGKTSLCERAAWLKDICWTLPDR